MSWRPSPKNNPEMVKQLKARRVIRSVEVEKAMLAVDRGNFCTNPYMDVPQPIGYCATISAPHMHAHVLELLKNNLTEGENALDVGSGSGYLTACMAVMVGPTGKVVGIDHIPELVNAAQQNISKSNRGLLSSGTVEFKTGDGRLGVLEFSPYNAIHVGAAAAAVPEELVRQLKIGGRLVVPVGDSGRVQRLVLVDKLQDGTVKQKALTKVIFVPLTDKKKQWPL